MEFREKTVIVTGGSDGIGAAIAHAFAIAGANLVLVARNKKKLDSVAKELAGLTKVIAIPMDVADTDACTNLFKKAQFEFGAVHILINNAGCHHRGTVESQSTADLARMIDVNLRAPIVLSRLAIRHITESGGGAIINIASLAGRVPMPGAATYSASKFGLRAFTRALSDELQGSKIKVAAVSPGPVDTDSIMAELDTVADLTFSQPLSSPETIAQAVVDVCSQTSGNTVEVSIPKISGLLTTIAYTFPWLGRAMRPMLERRGRDKIRELKAKHHQQRRNA